MMGSSLYIGIMSGTSLDGIDVALVNISPKEVMLINSHCYPIPADLKEQLIEICTSKQVTLQAIGEADHRLGHLYADCVNLLLKKHHIDPDTVCAIGCHGQTIYHAPTGRYPFTQQIGDANIIAAKTGIITVADFRRKDMAYGGQGAPLVPAFHQHYFACADKNSVILNIGGIANVTVIFPNQPVIGYDIGAGNLLLDAWVNKNKGLSYDKNAIWAYSGTVNPLLLAHLLDENYFRLPAPKSTGRELFNLNWLMGKLAAFEHLLPQDVQATLVELTTVSITHELDKLIYNTDKPYQLLVCGGGAHNSLIMERLTALLPNWSVMSTSQLSIDVDYVEAVAFAWLAYQRLHGLPGNIPSVTGATQAVSLGTVYLNNESFLFN